MSEQQTYSKSDLDEFREIINARLDEARKQHDLLNEQLDGMHRHINQSNMSYGDDSRRYQQESFLIERLANQKKKIREYERALLRIENGTYGVCEVTGELIDKDRLKAKPTATMSVAARRNMRTRRQRDVRR